MGFPRYSTEDLRPMELAAVKSGGDREKGSGEGKIKPGEQKKILGPKEERSGPIKTPVLVWRSRP